MDKASPTPSISPCFIVRDVETSVSFYVDELGFSVEYADPPENPFFAIVRRDGAMIFLKAEGGIEPVPNKRRHRHLRWDAYVSAPDPDALYEDFSRRGARFSEPLGDTHDGLRGFEVIDPDGLVLFFGRPAELVARSA